jgi:hypothetical protein
MVRPLAAARLNGEQAELEQVTDRSAGGGHGGDHVAAAGESGKAGLFPSQKLMPGSGINIQSECHPDFMRALNTAG